jgi:hypothetical protein
MKLAVFLQAPKTAITTAAHFTRVKKQTAVIGPFIKAQMAKLPLQNIPEK